MVSSAKRANYFALSYCWGPGPHNYQLTKEKLGNLQQQIPASTLSKTISDAIFITQQLGYRYLWVDALCIVQDDAEDWRRESLKMAEVYGNATCTISATAAEDSTVGCFPHRTGLAYPVSPCTILGAMPDGKPYTRTLMPSVPDWDVAVAQAPINNRVWTFQERALSHCILHWTQHELFWECREKRASETWVEELPNPKVKDTVESDGLWASTYNDRGQVYTKVARPLAFQEMIHGSGFPLEKWWQAIVIETSRRKRTVDSDILPALSGLASIIQHHSKDAYLVGLWRSQMPRSLFWRALYTGHWPLPEKQRPKDFPAPSWSWVSVVGEISFPGSSESSSAGYIPEIDIIDVDVGLMDGLQPSGQVTGGVLRLKAVLSRELTAVHRLGTTGCYFSSAIRESMKDGVLSLNEPSSWRHSLEVIYDVTPSSPLQIQSLFLMRAYRPDMSPGVRIKAIALEKIKWSRRTFRRVGWLDECDQSWFDSQDPRIIEII